MRDTDNTEKNVRAALKESVAITHSTNCGLANDYLGVHAIESLWCPCCHHCCEDNEEEGCDQ